MLRSLKELEGYVLGAEDGEFGYCHDFLLDDRDWTVRYMVADTGKWLPGRRVLVSPIALGDPDWERKRFPVRLTRAQLEAAPDLDADAPVTRQYEIWYHQHYGWPYYWAGTDIWSMGIHPELLYDAKGDLGAAGEGPEFERPHVHGVRQVLSYAVEATDDRFGHVADLIVDDETWRVRYAVVAMRHWLPGGKAVLVPLAVLDEVDWDARALKIGLTRDRIADLPEYDPGAPVNREMEERIYDYVGRPLD